MAKTPRKKSKQNRGTGMSMGIWSALVHALEGGPPGKSQVELAKELDKTKRHIQRYLRQARARGLSIKEERMVAEHNLLRYCVKPGTGGHPLLLNDAEITSLKLAHQLLEPLTGTHLHDSFNSILAKVDPLVPAETLDKLNAAHTRIYVRRPGHTDYAAFRATIHILEEAIHQQRRVAITYRRLGQADTFETTLDPYSLVYYEEELYVVGRSGHADALRVFKVSRIESAAKTEGTFSTPNDFDVEQHFKGSFGIFMHGHEHARTWVRVRFTGMAAQQVTEHRYHYSQELELVSEEPPLFDTKSSSPGTVEATFRLADVTELKRWIRTFGDQAEVLGPPWLRAEIRAELARALNVYEETASCSAL